MIFVFGDSIATGQYVPVHQSWPVLLSRRSPVQVAARNGDTTRLALERMAFEIQSQQPETLLVQFGMNDANHWASDEGLPRVSLPAFRANLREIVARGRAFGAEVHLLTNHPTRKGSTFERGRLSYNREIREVAWEHGSGLIDMERDWVDGKYLHDAIHLNRLGHVYYFTQVCNALKIGPASVVAHHPV